MVNTKHSPPKRILVHKLSTMLTKVFNGRNDIKTLIILKNGFVICLRVQSPRVHKIPNCTIKNCHLYNLN